MFLSAPFPGRHRVRVLPEPELIRLCSGLNCPITGLNIQSSLEGYIFRRLKVTAIVLVANDIFRLFISSRSQEDRLTELVVMCPLGKFDLGNPDGFDPVAAFHDRRCNPEAPSAF